MGHGGHHQRGGVRRCGVGGSAAHSSGRLAVPHLLFRGHHLGATEGISGRQHVRGLGDGRVGAVARPSRPDPAQSPDAVGRHPAATAGGGGLARCHARSDRARDRRFRRGGPDDPPRRGTGSHHYWAMVAAVVPLAGHSTRHRVARGLHRILGTFTGIALMLGIMALHPPLVAVAVLMAVFQYGAELYIARNYFFAQTFVTPLALLGTSIGGGLVGAAGLRPHRRDHHRRVRRHGGRAHHHAGASLRRAVGGPRRPRGHRAALPRAGLIGSTRSRLRLTRGRGGPTEGPGSERSRRRRSRRSFRARSRARRGGHP